MCNLQVWSRAPQQIMAGRRMDTHVLRSSEFPGNSGFVCHAVKQAAP